MNSRQSKTLREIFEEPTRSDIRWLAIESLLMALGAEKHEREGSRVVFVLKGRRMHLHKPHPKHVANKSTVEDVRRFLASAEIEP